MIIYIKVDLALNNLQRLICHKTQSTNKPTNQPTSELKRKFFQDVAVSVLLYSCAARTLTKLLMKKLDGGYTRIFHALLNKSWK